jgi:hypothetical protein
MPFPVIGPVGALVASIILGAVFTLFGVVLWALDRTVTRVEDSILAGLVSGFRGWSAIRRAATRRESPGSVGREESASPVPVEHVRAGLSHP